LKGTHACSAGIVDEDVEPPQFLDGSIHHRHHLVFDLDIGWHDKALAARVRRHRRSGPLQIGDRAGGDRDIGAALGEQHRCRGADPRSTARHQRHPAGEIECIVVEHRHTAYVPAMGRMRTSCAVLATICPDMSRIVPRTRARWPVRAAVSCV
jgi:hypothetical protein